MSDQFEYWANFYADAKDRQMVHPSETLVRLMKGGNYLPHADKDYPGKSVVEIGFGHGNNMYFLGELGLKLHGVEVEEDICRVVNERMKRLGLEADLRTGSNTDNPFDDNSFDFLVSWDCIHYCPEEQTFIDTVAEYARVMKSGGRIFISTVAPNHSVFTDMKRVGPNLVQLGSIAGFREGENFFLADTPEIMKGFFDGPFTDVEVGRVTLGLFKAPLDYYVITGVKA